MLLPIRVACEPGVVPGHTCSPRGSRCGPGTGSLEDGLRFGLGWAWRSPCAPAAHGSSCRATASPAAATGRPSGPSSAPERRPHSAP